MTKLKCVWAALLGTLIWGGCEVKKEDPDADMKIEANVDDDTPGVDLDDDEATELCETIFTARMNVEEKIDKIVATQACDLVGITAGGIAEAEGESNDDIQDACRDAVRDCKRDPPSAEDMDVEYIDPEDACRVAADRLTGCEQEVGDIVDCFNTILERQLDDAYEYDDQIPECSDLNARYYRAIDTTSGKEEEEPALPPQCLVIEEECARIMLLIKD
ncbi:MAG: hypothetical protein JXR76_02735 [Deltaproteobacteria bacterium]|nr:hypothetical protein [Deltaproteobacteria bacterium]